MAFVPLNLDTLYPEPQRYTIPETPTEALMNCPPNTEPALSHQDFDRLGMLVDSAVGSLDSIDADIVIAKVFEQLSFKQIGDRLGISKSNAHWRYNKAVEVLRTWLVDWALAKVVRPCQGLSDNPEEVTQCALPGSTN